jgi:hypothetical protein
MPSKKYTTDEIGDRAEKIYQEQIRPLVEPRENGKFIVIDIESGDYEIAEDMFTAEDSLKARRPDAVGFGGKVGYDAPYHIGWGGSRIDD